MPHIWDPIITSRLDTDYYKLTMGQFVFHRYPYIPVVYGLKNRTKGIKIADFVDEKDLCAELNHLRMLPLKRSEFLYLKGLLFPNGKRVFQDDYLEFLESFTLPAYSLKKENGEYVLTFPGEWSKAIYWESPALAIITELTYREMMKRLDPEKQTEYYHEGMKRLLEKCDLIKKYSDLRFMEFGTRRRFQKYWQEYIVENLKALVPLQLIGTSNVLLAMRHGLKPLGTFAHELYMAFAGIYHKDDDDIRRSHGRVLDEWKEEYGPYFLTALTDVFGSQFFFSDFASRASEWQILRQDSGSPSEFGEAAIRFFQDCGIDPSTKGILFSDGLDIHEIIRLLESFGKRIQCSFGWGTNITNDLGFPSISSVIKIVECCGHPGVKLSDNLAKATGPIEEIERYKKIFRYTGTLYEPCTY